MLSYNLVISHIRAAQLEASKLGVNNVLQPGVVKEMLLAEILNHELVLSKDKPDAVDSSGNFYEYLCSLQRSANFQLDRITKNNLYRVTRNRKFYFGFFSNVLTVEKIFEVDTAIILKEVLRQLSGSKNTVSHINISGRFVLKHGTLVFDNSEVRDEQ